MRSPLTLVIATALLLSLTLIAAAQNQPLAFEVATVKQHAMTVGGGFVGTRISGSLVTVSISTLKRLIQNAYQLQPYQISGGPAWVDDNTPVYDITARAPGDQTPTAEEARLMLQALLADRFKLSFHREMREVPVYTLVIAKNGAKLQPTTGGQPGARLALGATRQMQATNMSLEPLVASLTGELGRPVLDQTGLTAKYDWELKWIADPLQATSAGTNDGPAANDLFTAVQEQLGLKLEATKAAIEVFVIDHAEKPDAN